MFHAEEIQQIINQLQHTEGMGYFDTLFLILKLIGLCSGPILLFAGTIAILYYIPKEIARRKVPVDTKTKLYEVKMVARVCSSAKIPLVQEVSTQYTASYKSILSQRGKIRYKITGILLPFVILIFAPLLFSFEIISMITLILSLSLVVIYLVIGWGLTGWDDWDTIGAREKFSEADAEEFCRYAITHNEDIFSHVASKDALECALNEVCQDQPFLVIVFNRYIS